MPAADPTYPLYPIACILAAAMLPLVLLTSFIRQSWNLGVAFLCFWLFFEVLTDGIDAIVWSNNADIKFLVYCDIGPYILDEAIHCAQPLRLTLHWAVSHIQEIAAVVKPMATLIITRRLYLITSLRSVEPPTRAARRKNLAIEWALGLGIPLLVAGPLYYVVQSLRFQVDEGFGCRDSPDNSILNILLVKSWTVIPPLVSITFYYPHVARVFYRHSREIDYFLQSNNSVSRTNYFRILALASIDILLTLPIGIATIVLDVKNLLTFGPIPFYFGWTYDHTDWQPEAFSYADIVSEGTFTVAQLYFTQWTSPVLAFVIFGLFGVTSEARASYWRIICTVGGWFGWKPTLRTRRARSPLGDIEFGGRPAQNSMSLGLESNPSYVNHGARAQDQPEGGEGEVVGEAENGSEKDDIEEVPRGTAEETNDERPTLGSTQPSASSQAYFGHASAEV
ncbi:unnamed protein product [Peniophora sp. CBMAI 1063]|nr:unnamed protein product [Peniophora sp. CBMAI 1063]